MEKHVLKVARDSRYILVLDDRLDIFIGDWYLTNENKLLRYFSTIQEANATRVVAHYRISKEDAPLEGLIELPSPFNVEYDYDALGEKMIKDALIAFEYRYGYSLQTHQEMKDRFSKTGVGGDYLEYEYNYEGDDGEICLVYEEKTRHDSAYSITLKVPSESIDYPVIPTNNHVVFSEEDMNKAMNMALGYGYAMRSGSLKTEEDVTNYFLEKKHNQLVIDNITFDKLNLNWFVLGDGVTLEEQIKNGYYK